METNNYIESEVEKHNQEVYAGEMSAHSKSVLRDQLKKEDKFWTYFDRDHINGFDDGEPQTTPDFNHYEGAE